MHDVMIAVLFLVIVACPAIVASIPEKTLRTTVSGPKSPIFTQLRSLPTVVILAPPCASAISMTQITH